jgi:23S rRNA C2498 (ribose-2'-O)-methylase RlmM
MSKERQANGKWKKVYEKELLTICDKLLKSNGISIGTKEWLEEGKRKNNPFELKQKMEKGLKKFYRLLQRLDAKRAEGGRYATLRW